MSEEADSEVTFLSAYWEDPSGDRDNHVVLRTEHGLILLNRYPYANGHLHMGHALNKILKDIIIKYKAMQGYSAPYMPGWDCHGLPIEWMVESEFKEKGLKKEDLSPSIFRAACREFADKWVRIQSEEFQRLGVFGDWDHPYLTMTQTSERLITEKLFSFLNQENINYLNLSERKKFENYFKISDVTRMLFLDSDMTFQTLHPV